MITAKFMFPVDEVDSQFFRFEDIPDAKTQIDSWHEVLPKLESQQVGFKDMPEKLNGLSDIYEKN